MLIVIFPPAAGCSFQVSDLVRIRKGGTRQKSVRGPERTSLTARSDRAVASGETAVNQLPILYAYRSTQNKISMQFEAIPIARRGACEPATEINMWQPIC
eukprot:5541436-Pleurochrysis_carterae.AAC.2